MVKRAASGIGNAKRIASVSGKPLVQEEGPDSEADEADDGEEKNANGLRGAGAALLAVQALAASRPLRAVLFLRRINALSSLVARCLCHHFRLKTFNHHIHSAKAYSKCQYLHWRPSTIVLCLDLACSCLENIVLTFWESKSPAKLPNGK